MDRTRCIPIIFDSYYGKGNDYQTWDTIIIIMITGMRENDNVAPGDASGNSYIQFGPKCENTVKALEKMGVLSDTWHLYNYDELDEIQKKTGVTE